MASGSTTTVLRREVGELRRRESRRVFDPLVYVGRLDGPRESFVVRAQDLPVLDTALRTEVVSRLLEDCEDPTSAWLTRAGRPEPYEMDVDWLVASAAAFAIHGRELATFHVVTRYGWRDVRTGESKEWKRLRL